MAKLEDAIAVFDRLLALFEQSEKPELQEPVARGALNRGLVLMKHGNSEEAIAAYDKLVKSFEQSEKPELQVLVATALFNKGATLKKLNKPQAALVVFDKLLSMFEKSLNPEIQIPIAMTLFCKGVALGEQANQEAAIATYDKLVALFEQSLKPEIQLQVVMALLNKGVLLVELFNPEAAITAFDKLLFLFEQSLNAKIQLQVTLALLNKGITAGNQTKPEIAIATFDKIIARDQSLKPELHEQVAMALFNKGVALEKLAELEAAIAVFDKLLVRFGKSLNPEIQKQVAMALLNKGLVLGRQNKLEDEIAVYNNLITRFERSLKPELQEQVARALLNKGVALVKQSNPETAIATFEKLLSVFEQSSKSEIQLQVARALLNKGFVLVKQSFNPEAAIAPYDKLLLLFRESLNSELQELVAMALLNKGIVLEKLEQQKLVTMVLSNNDVALEKQADPEAAMVVYDELITRFEKSENPKIIKFVKQAFFNKGIAYKASSKWGDAVKCFEKYLEKVKLPWNNFIVKDKKDYTLLLGALISIFEKCNEKIQEAQRQLREEKLEEVCHFTGLDALYSILGHPPDNKDKKLDKNVLRAYNAIYMNDPSEGKALIEYSHRHANNDIFDLTEFFKDAERNWIDHDAAKSVYSISFTADNDSLTLWRAYGRDGNGVCIVIPVRTLNQFDGDNLIGANYFNMIDRSGAGDKQLYYSTTNTEGIPLMRTMTMEVASNNKETVNKTISENLFKVRYISLDENGKNKTEKDPDEDSAAIFLKSLQEPLNEIKRIKSMKKYKCAAEEIDKATREAFAGSLYLFKDAQYKPEHEYRMLDMRPINDKSILMDKQFPPHLYLETRPFVFEDSATRLIIGPAVENPENVTLSVEHILTKPNTFSKKIKCQLSKVNYRPAKK